MSFLRKTPVESQRINQRSVDFVRRLHAFLADFGFGVIDIEKQAPVHAPLVGEILKTVESALVHAGEDKKSTFQTRIVSGAVSRIEFCAESVHWPHYGMAKAVCRMLL